MEHVIKYFGCRNDKTNKFLFEFFDKTKDEIIDGLRKIQPLWSNEAINALFKKEQFYDYNIQHKNDKPIIVKKEIKEEVKTDIVKEENTKTTSKKDNLTKAKRVKNDEFYTRLQDIEKELTKYRNHFKDKVVYCNCDKFMGDHVSNFYNYFTMNFKYLGLKKLICSYYNEGGHGKVVIFEGIKDPNRNEPLIEDSTIITLNGDGSYDSKECLNYLKESDIVVTNPPFSLFRDYVATLMENNKKFVIMGNGNAITYKEIFKLIKENKLWLGYLPMGSETYFHLTDEAKEKIVKEKKEGSGWANIDGEIFGRVTQVVWFTNLEISKREELLALDKEYKPTVYPTYDNYEAIECNKVYDIPCDYYGVIGVPISFLNKYNPNQFEIIGLMSGSKGTSLINGNDGRPKFYLNGKGVYARILIRRKQ